MSVEWFPGFQWCHFDGARSRKSIDHFTGGIWHSRRIRITTDFALFTLEIFCFFFVYCGKSQWSQHRHDAVFGVHSCFHFCLPAPCVENYFFRVKIIEISQIPRNALHSHNFPHAVHATLCNTRFLFIKRIKLRFSTRYKMYHIVQCSLHSMRCQINALSAPRSPWKSLRRN